jgi:gluconokinase
VRFVHLKGDPALIRARLAQRRGHYMPASLLDSQLATLEEPLDAITVDIDRPPGQIVAGILDQLGRGPSSLARSKPPC